MGVRGKEILIVSNWLKKSNFNRVVRENIYNSPLFGRSVDNKKLLVNIASDFFHMNNVLMILFEPNISQKNFFVNNKRQTDNEWRFLLYHFF